MKILSFALGMLVLTVTRQFAGATSKEAGTDYQQAFSGVDALFSVPQAHAETPTGSNNGDSTRGGSPAGNSGCGGDAGGSGVDSGDGCGDGPCSC